MKPASAISQFTPALVAFCVGSAMWYFAGAKLADSKNTPLEFRPNILAIKGSPLGKTFALAVQGDIDFAWHEGMTNPFEEHDHSNCDHGNGVCSHDHKPAKDHSSCDHGHGHCNHDHVPSAESPTSDSWLRDRVDQMTASVYASNSPYELTDRHRKHIRENVEQKIAFAYSLDPENYLNYNSLHLFYETTLGNDVKSADQLIELAKQTRAAIREFTIDPEPWVTAASTQSNICGVIVNQLGLEGREQQFVDHLNDMRHCLIRFDRLRQEKIRNGSWQNIAAPRRDQMLQRFLSTVREHSNQCSIYERLTESRSVPKPLPPLDMANTPTL